MLPGTHMHDMLPCALQTYHRDHILLNFCQISENRCFRSILVLMKIVKTVCFWSVFAVLSGFWPYVTMDICMMCCSMRSQPIAEVISCSIFAKSVKIGPSGDGGGLRPTKYMPLRVMEAAGDPRCARPAGLVAYAPSGDRDVSPRSVDLSGASFLGQKQRFRHKQHSNCPHKHTHHTH